MEALLEFIRSIPWFAWIPILAIVGGTLHPVTGDDQRHIERMAMIKAGMDPTAIRKVD